MKIAVYAISKNEAQFVKRFCEAAQDADMVLIADTGSTDDTCDQVMEQFPKAKLHHISVKPWRFDLARNATLAMIPADYEVCISLDLDEILQPGWRQEIERVWKEGETTRLRYLFDWGAGIAFYYEKIHHRNGYFWHHPCHEYPMPDGRINEVWAQTDMLLAVHKPDPTKSRGQYLDLLKLSVEEDPVCPRNAFYYARELSFHGYWEESIKECDRYLSLPRATWPNERCYAYRTKGRCFTQLGRYREAETAYHLAAGEAPDTREPWFELTNLMYLQHRWAECFAYACRTLSIERKELVYTVDPQVWGSQPHDFKALAAHYLGLKDVAIQEGLRALELSPENDRLKKNMDWYAGVENA